MDICAPNTSSRDRVLSLADLLPGSKDVRCQIIVLERFSVNTTKDSSELHNFLVADMSGMCV